MKSNKNNTFFLTFCILGLLFETGCKDAVSIFKRGSNASLMDMIGPTDILSRYDTSNIVGIIQLQKSQYSITTQVTPVSERTNYDGTQSGGFSNFIDSNGNPLDIVGCVFNAQLLHLAAGLYNFNGTNLPIYTDGVTPNYVFAKGYDSSFGTTVDSLTFGAPAVITNIVRGQNISRDSTITVTWTGISSDFVGLNIECWDSSGTHDTIGKGDRIGSYFNNTGSATLSVVPIQLELGLADITLTKYEPKFVTLSSGKRICVVCETSDEITIHIVN